MHDLPGEELGDGQREDVGCCRDVGDDAPHLRAGQPFGDGAKTEDNEPLPTWWTSWSVGVRRGVTTNGWSGGPEGSHLRAPADPGVTVSRHRALLDLAVRTRGPTARGRSSAGTGGWSAARQRAPG